jgi:hypothetical protein
MGPSVRPRAAAFPKENVKHCPVGDRKAPKLPKTMIGNDASDAGSCRIRTKERAPREMHPAQGKETYRLYCHMLFTGGAKDYRGPGERIRDRTICDFPPKKIGSGARLPTSSR